MDNLNLALRLILSFNLLLLLPCCCCCCSVAPPLPILPLPNAFQIQWQLSHMSLFFHFGLNTFTGQEWGSGHVHPSLFNPTNLNATHWIHLAKLNGFNRVILTAKHHDGFCLWPSQYTNYSVRSSPWKAGTGDVLADLSAAAKLAGVDLGIYLSPWDRHEHCYGDTLLYNQFYLAQMTELLTRYGEIKDVFLDGAKGEGEKDMEYFFHTWFSLIHQLQPAAIIFSDAGPDTRWVGNELGLGASTCWSIYNSTLTPIGGIYNDPRYAAEGDPAGHEWVPALCDVSIRPGWFWHPSELPKSAINLLEIYYKSVGRNCHLLLNVPPNSSGLISPEDIQVLQEFTQLRRSIFSNNFAINALLQASSTRGEGGGTCDSQFSPYNVLKEGIYTYWAPEEYQLRWILYIDLQELVSFNVLQLQEPIQMGQRVSEFHLEALHLDGVWKRVTNGTTIGYQRLLLFPKVKSQHLKLVIDKSRADPLISYLGIYMDPVTIWSSIYDDTVLTSHFNATQVIHIITQDNSPTATILEL
ncbi:alpha-L-fucosidase 1-like [Arachis duranensis]|uniref:alpha-L-fucosidase n=1 Tax=Arachis duranensis TaxID=130453 RepID=A0A9C6WPR3_ARADU|nr:alpha-L-fucosidase 1 [Arachis duranensis]XP_052108955.1 alpha-L-fucosidase 1 [Arachis duranensis]XP_052112474.1 alpha-L-fucosidase 1-like [Arachis duranensis]XP_052112475.1 alpha-L-fucosidase 1-like [Arachis duranensis]